MKQLTIKKLFTLNQNLYNSQSVDWDKSRQQIWERSIIDFATQIPSYSTILDVGCGNARLYQFLQDKTINYTGIDDSKELIDLCRQKYPKANFINNNALDISYNNQFDYAFSIAVLHHIPSTDLQIKFLKNIFNSLKTNGKLFLTVWNRYQNKYKKYFDKNNHVYSLLDFATIADLSVNDLLVPWRDTNNARYVYAYTSEELKKQAEIAGFKNINVSYSAKQNINSNIDKGLFIVLQAQK